MPANSQNDGHPKTRACGTMIQFHTLAEQDPGYRARLAGIENDTQRRVARMAVAKLPVVAIPVVVHVVYKKAAENISDAQIQSQIDVLNADYTATNTDLPKIPPPWKGMAGDARVRFKLATKDPSGKATTGIVRRKTTIASFGQNNGVKSTASGGSPAWDTARYLNIWVCNLGDGLLGYAQFPGGPPATDGVVIRYTAFGTVGAAEQPFHLGRSATHEVGHFLNLRHIWGDTEDCSGSDLVGDTPRQQLPNYGAPTFPHISCGNAPNGDMFMNYMDYVDDPEMFMFTAGQVTRMRATLAGPRAALIKNSASRT